MSRAPSPREIAADIAFRARFSGEPSVPPSSPSAAQLRALKGAPKDITARSEIRLFANRFGLTGEATLSTGHRSTPFDVEGYRHQEVLVDIFNTTQNLTHHPELFSSEAAEKAFWTNIGQAALMAAGADNPEHRKTTVRNATTPSTSQLNIGFNRTGTSNHVAGQLFCTLTNGKSYYILANRGDRSPGKKSGLTIQTYDPRTLTSDQLDHMQQQDNIAQVDSTPRFRGSSIRKTLKAKKPVATIAMKEQKTGNCTVANTNALVFGALMMERIRQLNLADPKRKDFDAAAQAVKPIYKQWKYQTKLHALFEMCDLFAKREFYLTIPVSTKSQLLRHAIEKLSAQKKDYNAARKALWADYKAKALETLIEHAKHLTPDIINKRVRFNAAATEAIKHAKSDLLDQIKTCLNTDKHLSDEQSSSLKSMVKSARTLAKKPPPLVLIASKKLRKGAPFGRTHRLRKALNSLYQSPSTLNDITVTDLHDQGLSTKQQQQFARVNLDAATENGNSIQLIKAIHLFEEVLGKTDQKIRDNFPKDKGRQDKYTCSHDGANEKYYTLLQKEVELDSYSAMASTPPAAGAGDPARASARPGWHQRHDSGPSETPNHRR